MTSSSATAATSTSPGRNQDHTSKSLTSVTRRTDLSLLYRVLRTLIRPFRPKLVEFPDPYPPGSPRIRKWPNNLYHVDITERKLQISPSPDFPLPQVDPTTNTQALWIYDFESKRLPKSKSNGENSGQSPRAGRSDSPSNQKNPPSLTNARSDSPDPNQQSRQKPKKWYTHTIYYFAGGGFQSPPSSEHWKFCCRLSRDLENEQVRTVLISYPLAPHSPAKDSLPLLRKWLVDELAEAAAHDGETITLMGDSAGGNVVLSLGFWWARRLQKMRQKEESGDLGVKKEIEALRRLRALFVMSPPCDFRNSNPHIDDADKLDPVLTRDLTDRAAEAWCKDWLSDPTNADPAVVDLRVEAEELERNGKRRVEADGKSDPALSPNLQTEEAWEALRQSGLVVTGVYGTADLLSPDVELFMERCREEEIRGEWLVWEGQMHCFPLTVCYGLREGKEGFEWVKARLKEW
ncbi:hypothetical protein H2198_002363 [Neophaeococcomyces mojaviensis]|uniref:Uncharacterized protein n=1 Tax=Neophaeococcomyces mojaviensis TaxID=3383035 RepID=A0ACC3AEL6_9EURO|nr:hypothetical protein H2198_002363 [Knufia sp. JES_112]